MSKFKFGTSSAWLSLWTLIVFLLSTTSATASLSDTIRVLTSDRITEIKEAGWPSNFRKMSFDRPRNIAADSRVISGRAGSGFFFMSTNPSFKLSSTMYTPGSAKPPYNVVDGSSSLDAAFAGAEHLVTFRVLQSHRKPREHVVIYVDFTGRFGRTERVEYTQGMDDETPSSFSGVLLDYEGGTVTLHQASVVHKPSGRTTRCVIFGKDPSTSRERTFAWHEMPHEGVMGFRCSHK